MIILLCSLQELAEKMSPTFSICFSKNKFTKNYIINIGISGGKKGDCSTGQLFLINKVSDEKSKLSFNLGSRTLLVCKITKLLLFQNLL